MNSLTNNGLKNTQRIELLAPAKNMEIGKEAILHGADAVYIGGPAFGARSDVHNSLDEIHALVDFAHRFDARVYIALNTLIKDAEFAEVERLIHAFYQMGADALIIQDMGILMLDLPPIALHASTQCDIRDPAKAHFLEEVGLSQLVLSRELSLPEIAKIRAKTTAPLEFFVHGALCVSYSGLCNLSISRGKNTGKERSANRGDCAQACRLPFDLSDKDGNLLAKNQHLLSLKDNDQSANLEALIAAGISSFKIEGRKKDADYVKNVTAFYRQKMDAILEKNPALMRASSGKSTFSFTPNIDKSFHRGQSDYFLHGRNADVKAITAFDSPKFKGEKIGNLHSKNPILVKTFNRLQNGDGFAAFDAKGDLLGFRVNKVAQIKDGLCQLWVDAENAQKINNLPEKAILYRNHDQAFNAALKKDSASRKIDVFACLKDGENGFVLQFVDENGVQGNAAINSEKTRAKDGEAATKILETHFAKLGNSIFNLLSFSLETAFVPFIPASIANALRREALVNLTENRQKALLRLKLAPIHLTAQYPLKKVDFRANILNNKAAAFYAQHGAEITEWAFEAQTKRPQQTVLMFAKHCLRFSFNLCPKQTKGIRPDPLILSHEKTEYTLQFDCKKCEMHVINAL